MVGNVGGCGGLAALQSLHLVRLNAVGIQGTVIPHIRTCASGQGGGGTPTQHARSTALSSITSSMLSGRQLVPVVVALLLAADLACASRLLPVASLSASPQVATKRAQPLNERPIIGILTQPGDPAPRGDSYIAASYVKWIEAAGARVVPIQYDLPLNELRRRFKAINGLLLPGGGANLSPGHAFYDTAAALVDMAIDANDRGDFFPVHGTCLGFEALAIIVSRNTSVLSDMDALNAPSALLYTEDADSSEWLRALPPHLVKNMQVGPLTFENHAHGVLTTAYEENAPLKSFFKVLALSLDNTGLPYISMMEARKYPFYATQFHPEKHAFEWASFLRIPHSPDAIEVTQELGNFFVSQARMSQHAAYDKNEEESMLIYNWTPKYTGRSESGKEEQDFQQTYIFASAAGDRKDRPHQQHSSSSSDGSNSSGSGPRIAGLPGRLFVRG